MPVPVPVISPIALAELSRQRPIRLIDVRTPGEFAQLHAQGAVNVPLEQVDAKLVTGHDETLYLICRAGSRGHKACELLLAIDPQARVVNVDGGTLAWHAAGLPTVRARKRMSNERKGRLLALVLIIISILLSIFVHKGLIGLAGLVAAGIVFAGMTNAFGMGLIIGKMPWYRAKVSNGTPNEATGSESANKVSHGP